MKLTRRQFLPLALAPLAAAPKRRKDSFFGLHFDLHANNNDVALGRDLTPAMAARLLDAVRPDYLQYDCKGHVGYMAYPSKVSRPAANIVNDSLAIWRKATADRDIGLYIHFSGVWDSLAIQEHPGWAAHRADGTPDPNATSLFGPYPDERMIPQLKEAVDRYNLDGAWIDGECWAVRPDYSPAAAAAFTKATGIRTLPKSPTEPYWQEFLAFHREAFRRYVKHYADELHRHRPSFQIASNWMYTTYMPERPDLPIDFVSGDYLGNASISTARLESRYLSAAGKPWDLMAWGFQHNPNGVIPLSHKTAVQLEQEASVVLAQGGGFQVYYQPTRAGWMDDRLIAVMARLARFCRERQAFSHQTETVPSTGVLFSAHSLYRTANRMFGGWGAHTAPARGLVDALSALHVPVDVIPEWRLAEAAKTYRCIVLPDWPDIGLAVKAQLLDYVRGGGNLLLCGAENAALFAPELPVTQRGTAAKKEAYIPGGELFANITGLWQDIEAGAAEVIENRYPAYDTTRDATPAATRSRLGKGQIAAIYGPVGVAYAAAHAAPAREFIGKVLGSIFTPDLTLDAPPSVEAVLRRKGPQLLLHLLNSTGMQVAAEYAVIDSIPAVGPIGITLRLPAKPASVTVEPGGRRRANGATAPGRARWSGWRSTRSWSLRRRICWGNSMTISCLLVLSRQLGSVPAAIRQFEEQDYPERELVILDAHSLAGLVDIPASPRIRLLQLPAGMNREAQLRFAAANADGELICEWEAGAWQAPGRLAAQKRKTRTATVLDSAAGTRMWRREAMEAEPVPIPGSKLFRAGAVPREGRAPMVSCVMPTRNRRWAVPLALEWFASQDYPSKELLVIDDGEMPVEDLVQGLSNVRYLRPNARLSVGAKRNLGCRAARGEFVAHWDDDDWMAPGRLSYQVGSLLEAEADLCGVEQMLYWEPLQGQAWRYVYPADQPRWVAGGSFLYRHSAWEKQPFDDVNVGEDNRFVWAFPPERVLPLPEFDFYVALLHAGNTSLKMIEPTRWAPADAGAVARLMGPAAGRFREALPAVDTSRRNSYQPPEAPLRPGASKEPPRFPVAEVPSFTLARAEHLALPEFAAFNNAVTVLYMRQWELPFALFQARLGEEMTVLDCTINPTCLGEAIEQLYPRVIYHHWQPLPNGRLSLPQGQAFDRVFCINTLEHLVAEEREQLMAAMAALLKPGGLLICTVDQYFASAWKDPAWLATGLLRADGAEVPNGFNRVDPEELSALGARHGLRADGVPPGKARARDAALFLNPAPFAHGSLGAVLRKGRAVKFAGARKVVLALLSWNTRDITLEALAALETEARMLARLGHEASICVVDNGSTDGASEALRKRKIGVPHKVIRNRANLGNSTARNQMIDYALAEGADYLFFCDGDIEPVPFSTFVMLRYMEAAGARLGCFGAYSFQCTPDRQRTTPFLFSLAGCPLQSSSVLAWTQYGMFRCRMFRDGVRFEESGPFGEPGHGLEDVDLAFQMNALGYENQYFSGMWYLHRNLSSSVGILREQGVNPTAAYYARRDYMVSKWENNPAAAQSLGWLRHARPPWPGEVRPVLRYRPGGPELAAPPAAIALAEAAASDMLDRVELEAIGWLLGSFDWKASPSAIVVEIGAYVGRTTVFMARLLGLFGVAPKIVSIDPFERCTPDNYNPQGSYSRYMAHLRENGVDRQCMALAAYSEDAAVAVPSSIGVLVIDGWHYYDTVRSDLALYLPKVVPGGFVFIDDYGPAYPDVVRAVDEFLEVDSEFEVLAKEYYVVLRRR